MPGTMITWFDLQSRNLNVLHVFRDSLGAWVFSMHVLRDFLSISPKQYFLLPFRKKTRFSHVSIRNKSYHISHITKVRSDNACTYGDFSEIKVTDEFFLKRSLNVLYKALFRKKENNKRIDVKYIWKNSYF